MAEPISILHSILATNFPGPLCSSTPTKTRARSSVRFVEACGVTAGARRQRAAASRKNSARDYYLRAMPRKPVLAISMSHPLMIGSARFQRAAFGILPNARLANVRAAPRFDPARELTRCHRGPDLVCPFRANLFPFTVPRALPWTKM